MLTFNEWLNNLAEPDTFVTPDQVDQIIAKAESRTTLSPYGKTVECLWWYQLYLLWWEEAPSKKDVLLLFASCPYLHKAKSKSGKI